MSFYTRALWKSIIIFSNSKITIKRENLSRLWAQIVSHTSWWQLLQDRRRKFGQYESHHEPVSGHRSGQVARGQGHMHTRRAAVCQEGFAKYKIKRGDTFFSISKEDSNLMEQIMSLSPDVDAGNLPVGKKQPWRQSKNIE